MKIRFFLLLWFLSLTLASLAHAQLQVASHQKISDTEGGFTGTLDDNDAFGYSVTALGDLDGDDVSDLAIGALTDDDGGIQRGAVWVLFMKTDGTVKNHQKISDTEGGFTGALGNNDFFGSSVTALGDLDEDGTPDLAVGAYYDSDNGTGRGAVWVLFLNPDGTVKNHQKIADNEGGFTGTLNDIDKFGRSVASMGDLDGDGTLDLAVGAYSDSDNGISRGAVWILFLNPDGTVKSHQKISSIEGGFTGTLGHNNYFGGSVASMGDLDGDGVNDLAVGAYGDDDGSWDHGAVWVLFMNTDGTVKSHQKISDTEGGFTGTLNDDDMFGWSIASMGDLDGDGVSDLTVGAISSSFDFNTGAVWVLFMNTDGTVKGHQKISDTDGGFTGTLDDDDDFGSAVALLGDLDGDGMHELVVGSKDDDDGGTGETADRGAVWILSLGRPQLKATAVPAVVAPGEPFTIEVAVGSEDLLVGDLFGVGFQLYYDPNEIDILSVSVGPLLDTGTPEGLILFEDFNVDDGIVSASITRTKGNPGAKGHGVVLSFKAEVAPGFVDGISEFTLKELLGVNVDGETLYFDHATGSLEVVGAFVWPGDADNSGTVDIDDVLPIGVHFDAAGPSRKDTDFSWTGQAVGAWTPEEAAYADATGDGRINQNDILPLGLNFGETVPGGAAYAGGGTAAKGHGSLADVTIPVTAVGEHVVLELSTAAEVSDLLGIAFELGLDPARFRIHDAIPGAFLDDGDVLAFDRLDPGTGIYAAAFTRKGTNPAATGTGALARVTLEVIGAMTAPAVVTLGRATLSYHGGTLDRAPSVALALLDATATALDDATDLPVSFRLAGAYPNPFNPSTTVAFDLPSSAEVTLVVYDVMGREVSRVEAGRMASGSGRTVRFEARGLASGTYLYRVLARTADGVEAQTGRFVLMK